MFGLFSYIRSRARTAVLEGIAEGLQDAGALDATQPTEGTALALLQQRLRELPAAPVPGANGAGNSVKEEEDAEEPEAEAAPATRRKR